MTTYRIPKVLNLVLCILVISGLVFTLFLSGLASTWWQLVGCAVLYGFLMNTGYALLHEATHRMLHTNRLLNDLCGSAMGLFFPASFHLIKLGHIGHHMRNRSDDEAFDFYFEGDNPVWKFLQLYGILTGMFWVTIVSSNLIALVAPSILSSKRCFDRPSQAFFDSFNPSYLPKIRLEAASILVLHPTLMWLFHVPPLHYIGVLFGFGFMWSAMQYAHHFGTTRDVTEGARNLTSLRWIDLLWLNQNWHLNHHRHPTVPWLYLPSLATDEKAMKRDSLFKTYLWMWRGPRFTHERVENRFSGRIIK